MAAYTPDDYPERLLGLTQVLSLIPYARSSVYRLIKSGRFPPPVRCGQNRVAWRDSDIREWLANPLAYPGLDLTVVSTGAF